MIAKSAEKMKFLKRFTVFFLYVSLIRETEGGGFFSGLVERVSGSYLCGYIDCCNKHWQHSEFDDFFRTLSREVYGQNIALEIIVPALKAHLSSNTNKHKALVFSFHGRPGIGKNHVANHIQKSIFQKNGETDYVHFFSGRNHFPLKSETDKYRVDLKDSIMRSVSRCAYSLFIFDEVDKMPPGVLDILVPFIDYHEKIDGVDFRKATFIFISNTGGDLIAQRYLQFWQNGRKRENLELRDFESLVMIGAFNEKDNGLYRSDTIAASLIDHYVPFLPLEEEQVRMCARDQFKKRNMYQDIEKFMKEILDDLTFGPDDNPIFSNSGCKRIAPKVAALAERARFRFKVEL